MTSSRDTTAAPTPTTKGGTASAPPFVRRSNPLVRALLRLGLPMGPNTLLTVRGRITGQPRTAPVAVVEIDGRRWVVGAYGEVNWVRNLRAAGKADIEIRGRTERVSAYELDRSAAIAFYREIVPRYVGRMPRLGRSFVRTLLRLVDARDVLLDPQRAAAARPVFELRPASSSGSM